MSTITSANAVLMLSINPIYPTPQQIQNFSVDDAIDLDPLEVSETQMGVDGFLSAGKIFVPIPVAITLKADSASNVIFDTWYATQNQVGDLYSANATITFSGIGKKYILTTGWLKTYPPASDAKRVLQARKFLIHWQSITWANTNTPVA